MTQQEMFENALWIDCPEGDTAPMFIKNFSAVKNEKAEIIICGLGYFELKINGKRVSDDLLVPAASNYSYRDMSVWSYPLYDNMSFRTYVMKYDISSFLTDGENKLSVMLGTGYYHQNMRDAEGNVDYGTPKLCFVIKKQSGNVISDKSTLCHKGYFKRCNLYYGEYQDFTAIPAEEDYIESREIETPGTDFCFNIAPSDKVSGVITDIVFIGELEGVKYYDAGINTVGRAVLKCKNRGEHIKVEYAETIGGEFWHGMHFGYHCMFIDEFIADGTDREYFALFGWQGFRYLRVTGDAEIVRIEEIHSDCKVTSDFECDNDTLNWLYKAFIHTQLCNMHSGVPSDCPHRERLGYTGDGQLCCESAMMMLDSKDFYKKWLYDIADCQCKNSGHVQHTAPAMGGGGGPCGWGGAIVEVPYQYYKAYGDKELLKEFLPKMLKFFEYLESRSECSLICKEEPDGWCLGDWLPPTPIQISETFVNSALYVGFMKKVKDIADVIGENEKVKFLDERIERVTAAINAAFYSPQQRAYCGDINGTSAIALQAGLGNEKVLEKVILKYNATGHYDTGIIATEALTDVLFTAGEVELAVKLLTAEDFPSFSFMKNLGATTIWENWDGMSSHNHPMFGAVTKFLFTELLGIKQSEKSAGYNKAVISPKFVDSINRIKGHITTANGLISVEYEKEGKTVKVKTFADENTNAVFIYNSFVKDIKGNAEFILEI